MPFKEFILTRRLLTSKLGKMKRTHAQILLSPRQYVKQQYIDLLKKSIDNNTVYCGDCGESIDDNDIGKIIVSAEGNTNYSKKWFHRSCAIKKNIIIEEKTENVSN